MSVTKILEVSSSGSSVEDAVQSGLAKVGETVQGIQGAWVNDVKVVTSGDGRVTEWRVNMRVSFVVK